jgi:hypothetical protein
MRFVVPRHVPDRKKSMILDEFRRELGLCAPVSGRCREAQD